MIDTKYISEKGEKIYYRIQPDLLKKYRYHQAVVINVNTGEYVVGNTNIEAMLKAIEKFGEKAECLQAHVGTLYGRL